MKKLFALFIAATLLLCMFSACSKNENPIELASVIHAKKKERIPPTRGDKQKNIRTNLLLSSIFLRMFETKHPAIKRTGTIKDKAYPFE